MNGSQLLRQHTLLPEVDDVFFKLAFQLVGTGNQVLDRAEISNEFLGGFFADARNARNIIDRIAHQP